MLQNCIQFYTSCKGRVRELESELGRVRELEAVRIHKDEESPEERGERRRRESEASLAMAFRLHEELNFRRR